MHLQNVNTKCEETHNRESSISIHFTLEHNKETTEIRGMSEAVWGRGWYHSKEHW